MPENGSGGVVCSSSLLLCSHPGRRQAETPLIQPVQKSRASSQGRARLRGGWTVPPSSSDPVRPSSCRGSEPRRSKPFVAAKAPVQKRADQEDGRHYDKVGVIELQLW